MVKLIMCRPPSVLLSNGSMVHKQSQTKMVMTISHADPPTVLLKNGFMVHNQTNTDRLRKLSATLLENVWLARMTLKVKMERYRSSHHVLNATRNKLSIDSHLAT